MLAKVPVSRTSITVLAAVLIFAGTAITIQQISNSRARATRERVLANNTPAAIAARTPREEAPAKPAEPGPLVTSTPTLGGAATRPTAIALSGPAGKRDDVSSNESWPTLLNTGGVPISTAAAPAAPATRPAADGQPLTHAQRLMAQVTLSGNPIQDGRAKSEAGDLLGARQILNEAILSGGLSDADLQSAKQLQSKINDVLIFSPKRFGEDPIAPAYVVQSGELMLRIAKKLDSTADFLCRINGITDAKRLRAGQTIKTIHGPFHAVVSKSKFVMDVYLGSAGDKGALYVTSYPVGLGKDDSTPTGVWTVQQGAKLKNPKYYSPRGEGIIAADDPKNPLGKFWIGLEGTDGQALGKQSYGIHGTIDPDSIGKQASMGCIRMRNEDVAVVFEMLIEGKSSVVVKD